jgi:acetyl-CoA C-acetyltransferase
MESMSGAPFLLPHARSGYRLGHGQVIDHLMLDGLEDAYEPGRSMGTFGEDTARAYQFTRADTDAFAVRSLTRARHAVENGAFLAEIVPVQVPDQKGAVEVGRDEIPLSVSPEKIPSLRAAFAQDGVLTAASSSANADGAAALGSRPSIGGRAPRHACARAGRRARLSRPGAGTVHNGADPGHPTAAPGGRLARFGG